MSIRSGIGEPFEHRTCLFRGGSLFFYLFFWILRHSAAMGLDCIRTVQGVGGTMHLEATCVSVGGQCMLWVRIVTYY